MNVSRKSSFSLPDWFDITYREYQCHHKEYREIDNRAENSAPAV